ncbi:MAG: EAL domain-containing protein [Gammaproteobacteria bacterium]|nr:EAL domain-containing protein [Gammaproteobacteria bacterium]
MSVLRFADEENRLRAVAEIDTASSNFASDVAQRARNLRDILLTLGTDENVRTALAERRDIDKLVSKFQNYYAQAKADVGMVYDANGDMLFRLNISNYESAQFESAFAAGRDLLITDEAVYDVVTVEIGADEPSGYMLMGHRIDDDIAVAMAARSGVDVTILTRTHTGKIRTLGSSLPPEERRMIAEAALRVSDGHAEAVRELENTLTSGAGLYIPDDNRVIVLFHKRVVESRKPFEALQGKLINSALISALGALILTALLSRAVTTPIRQLLMAARRMSVGNYNTKLEINKGDEFGELAQAFEKMRIGIAEREQRIVYQAEFDPLTGLPNRTHAMESLREILRNASQSGDSVVVMVMHMQRFREIQSSLGHEVGDEVLRQTAQRLRAGIDEEHILARLEGDQFVVIAPGADKDEGKRLARRLAGLLDAGFNVQDVNVTLDACIGMCVSPEHGRQPDELLRRAAVAKNDAQQGQKRIVVYQNGREARHVRQLAILGDMRRACRENELEIYLQPKVELSSTQVCGAEALLRWNHPELGQIAPFEFIPLAERAGCIGMLTEWMLGRAVAQARSWHDQGINLPIAVNLSAQDLLSENLISLLENELDANKMKPDCLVLEITEEALVTDIDYAIKILERLRDMGFRTSMDDFGTGYSSLGHLQRLPIDEIKVDRSFVGNLPEHSQNAAIVRAIINMAHNLGLEVVAEGVETSPALRWLREEGCERAQGYFLSKPMPVDEFVPWMREWESLTRNELVDVANHDESLMLRPRLIT